MNLPWPTTPTFVPALRALARSTRHSTRAALPRVFPRDLFTRRNARRGGRQRSRARDREREKNIVDRSLESDLFFKDFCTRLGWRGRRVEASTAVQREAASARDLSNTFRHGNKKRKGRGMKKKKVLPTPAEERAALPVYLDEAFFSTACRTLRCIYCCHYYRCCCYYYYGSPHGCTNGQLSSPLLAAAPAVISGKCN